MEDDPRARFLLESVGDAAKKLRPETVEIETVRNVAGAKDSTILQQLDDPITKRGYNRVVPDGGASPERILSSRLGSVANRTRLAVHYERDDMGGEPLPMLPAALVTGTKMEALVEHLVPNADDLATPSSSPPEISCASARPST